KNTRPEIWYVFEFLKKAIMNSTHLMKNYKSPLLSSEILLFLHAKVCIICIFSFHLFSMKSEYINYEPHYLFCSGFMMIFCFNGCKSNNVCCNGGERLNGLTRFRYSYYWFNKSFIRILHASRYN